jgi:methionine-rich copper-binding protein CopC
MRRKLSLMVLIGGLLLSGNAVAHARLTLAVPAADSVVAAAPATISLTFNETVMLITCKVVDAEGREVGEPAMADGKTVRVPLKAGLGAGRYSVNYRVAGDDGHAMNGTMSFTVQAAKP